MGLLQLLESGLQVAQAALFNRAAARSAADGISTDGLASSAGIAALHAPLIMASCLTIIVASVQISRSGEIPMALGGALLLFMVLGFGFGHLLRRTTAIGRVCFNLGGVFHNSTALVTASYLAA